MPALGRPTRPASAISFSRSQIVSSSPAQAGIGAPRRLVHRGLEIGVAEAAIAAGGDAEALADMGEVADQRLVVLGEDLGAGRHLQRHVGALGAVAVAAHAVHAGLGLEVLLVAIVDQRVEAGDRLDPDVAAAAAVAAVRSPELDEFLAAERYRAGTAVAGADIDLGLVEELHRVVIFRLVPSRRCSRSLIAAGRRMETGWPYPPASAARLLAKITFDVASGMPNFETVTWLATVPSASAVIWWRKWSTVSPPPGA